MGLLMKATLPEFPHRRKGAMLRPQEAAGGVRRRRNTDAPDTTKPEIA